MTGIVQISDPCPFLDQVQQLIHARIHGSEGANRGQTESETCTSNDYLTFRTMPKPMTMIPCRADLQKLVSGPPEECHGGNMRSLATTATLLLAAPLWHQTMYNAHHEMRTG